MNEGGDPERTMMVPSPGGRRAPSGPAPAPQAAPSGPRMSAQEASNLISQGSGLNPLVRAANPLLALIVPLRHMAMHSNLEDLRQQLTAAIKHFESEARAAQVDMEAVAAARYALCTFLDETISSTPWGGNNAWSSRSMLVTFHNEAFGGEKFFLIMQKLAQNPKANLNVLELMYLCLSLGMEGRYRVVDNGRAQLESLRERLQQMIQKERGNYEPDLSLRWRGTSAQAKSLIRVIPIWVMVATALVLVLIWQVSYSFLLSRSSDPVFSSMGRIKLDKAVPLPPPPEPAKPVMRVARFLEQDIKAGTVDVKETADRSIVTIHGDGLFSSGSAQLVSSFEPLMGRIGEALKTVPGKVMVIGHTDDLRPGFGARYPSNFELSKARAQAVETLLAQRAGPNERYSVEGHADNEPLVKNDSAANRARNRRVDIIVMAQVNGQ
jgi:type VI secretion system protein ImpK